MKVIGKIADDKYIAEVSHLELEKLTDKYYGKLDKLKVGDMLDLGAGHDFRNEIRSACKSMTEASERFERAQKTMMRFAVMVANLPESSHE